MNEMSEQSLYQRPICHHVKNSLTTSYQDYLLRLLLAQSTVQRRLTRLSFAPAMSFWTGAGRLLVSSRLSVMAHLLATVRIFEGIQSTRTTLLALSRPFCGIVKKTLPGSIKDLGIISIQADVICVLHPLHTDISLLVEVEHRLGIDLEPIAFRFGSITRDRDTSLLLILDRRFVRLVDVFLWQILQLRHILADVVSIIVPFLAKCDRAVAPVELCEEGSAGQPLPVPDVARGFVIDQELLEDVGAALPGDVASTASEEAGNGMTCEVVDPAFIAELTHDGVDPGEACRSGSPALEPGFFLFVVNLVFAGDNFRV